MSSPTLLVVSAHAADFVWRCSGTIALYRKLGARVRLLVLSFGERGESAEQWKQPGATLERVKANRRAESAAAAEALGVGDDVRFFDLGDYPLRVDDAAMAELVRELRAVRPDYVLTHAPRDPYNMDHGAAAEVTLAARVQAQAHGMLPELPVIGAPPVYAFEPHQPEMCDFKPTTYVDVTPVFDRKLAAMKCMATQQHLWAYYEELALRRGAQAVRNGGGKGIKYAEAFMAYYPHVGPALP
ncbi:MAG: PIG-L deacetylase family protein [Candidatus Rokuibacteriota bacterium]